MSQVGAPCPTEPNGKDTVVADSPIRIAVELEGIEPDDRLQAALDELVAAAGELIEESGPEVAGYFTAPGDVAGFVRGDWIAVRPGVKRFETQAILAEIDRRVAD